MPTKQPPFVGVEPAVADPRSWHRPWIASKSDASLDVICPVNGLEATGTIVTLAWHAVLTDRQGVKRREAIRFAPLGDLLEKSAHDANEMRDASALAVVRRTGPRIASAQLHSLADAARWFLDVDLATLDRERATLNAFGEHSGRNHA